MGLNDVLLTMDISSCSCNEIRLVLTKDEQYTGLARGPGQSGRSTYLHQAGDRVSNLVAEPLAVIPQCSVGYIRGDINEQLLLPLGFFCLDPTLFGFNHSLLLCLFIELAFSDVGL